MFVTEGRIWCRHGHKYRVEGTPQRLHPACAEDLCAFRTVEAGGKKMDGIGKGDTQARVMRFYRIRSLGDCGHFPHLAVLPLFGHCGRFGTELV
jgi:hypothetical protein